MSAAAPEPERASPGPERVPLSTVAREWGRIGLTGFGGPPAHIALLRALMVDRRGWLEPAELEDAIAASNLLPGPASTQLAILCAGRVAGPSGAIVGGLCFIVPAVLLILALSLPFLAHAPPLWVRGAGAGAGAAVAAVAVHAAVGLMRPSWNRAKAATAAGGRARRVVYAVLGGVADALIGPYLVLVLLACRFAEVLAATGLGRDRLSAMAVWPLALPFTAALVGVGSVGALVWVAFKVGALSYGGGFVIVPLMQHDAVHTYHWMSSSRFLDAVALGQVTPGPVVVTVAAVGYAARGGRRRAARRGGRVRAIVHVRAAGCEPLRAAAHQHPRAGVPRRRRPAAIGAILGAAIPLAGALGEWWQFVLLAAALALLVLRRGVVGTLVAAGVIGAAVALAGGAVP